MTKKGLLGIGVVAILAFGALVSACGDDDDNGLIGNGNGNGDDPADMSPAPSDGNDNGDANGNGDGDENGDGNGNGGGNGETISVVTNAFDYSPGQVTATAGEELTVEYENNDGAPHSFTIDGVVDTGVVAGGESTSVSFTPDAGSYTFYCTVHGEASMSGTLEVN